MCQAPARVSSSDHLRLQQIRCSSGQSSRHLRPISRHPLRASRPISCDPPSASRPMRAAGGHVVSGHRRRWLGGHRPEIIISVTNRIGLASLTHHLVPPPPALLHIGQPRRAHQPIGGPRADQQQKVEEKMDEWCVILLSVLMRA